MAGLMAKALGRTAGLVPGLKRIPIMKLLMIGEVAILAREHASRLSGDEWRRLLELMRIARGRPSSLSARQRSELESLVAKAEPRQFAGAAVDKLSPVPIPNRLLYGSSKDRKKLRR